MKFMGTHSLQLLQHNSDHLMFVEPKDARRVMPVGVRRKRREPARPRTVRHQTAVLGNGFGLTRDKFGTQLAQTTPLADPSV